MAAILFVIAFCVVAVLVYMARYSGRMRVAHTRLIDAPIEVVYERVADFRHWDEWNPWLAHELDAPTSLSDQRHGKSGSYAWEGDRIGAAAIENIRLVRPEIIEQRMRFQQPFRFRGRGEWQFADRAGKTEVTWRMNGRVAFALRAFAQTVQGMVALDYRYGLDRLAQLLEPAAASRYSLAYLGVRDVPAMRYVYRSYDGSIAGLGAAMRSCQAELRRRLSSFGVSPSAEPIAVYLKTNIKLRTTVCHFGLPVADSGVGDLAVREMPAFPAYVVRLRGTHAVLEVAWYLAMQRMRIENIEPDQRIPPLERYLGDFDAGSGNDHLTELHIPVRQRP